DEKASAPMKSEVIYSEDDMESSGDSDEEKKSLSKKKQRKLGRLTVVELKQLIKELEVVEWTDVTTADPPPNPHRQTPNAVWHGNAFGHGQCCLYHYVGPWSLYQVVPEKQTSVRGSWAAKGGTTSALFRVRPCLFLVTNGGQGFGGFVLFGVMLEMSVEHGKTELPSSTKRFLMEGGTRHVVVSHGFSGSGKRNEDIWASISFVVDSEENVYYSVVYGIQMITNTLTFSHPSQCQLFSSSIPAQS
ncbi:hypothetical protein C0993_000449, partial [Termitomyces sp. T159_Od127]